MSYCIGEDKILLQCQIITKSRKKLATNLTLSSSRYKTNRQELIYARQKPTDSLCLSFQRHLEAIQQVLVLHLVVDYFG